MSETNELEALLRRWAELEPDRCFFYADSLTACCVRVGHYETSVSDASLWPHRITHPHHIQAAVQEAIEARGWLWTRDICGQMIVYPSQDSTACPECNGWIEVPITDAFDTDICATCEGTGDNRIGSAMHDTPAIALLTAYLAALESTTP